MTKARPEILLFEQLRLKVLETFQSRNAAVPSNFKEWSGQDITLFQEDLQDKVQTSISEKWFYTYFKQDQVHKLPRIDMLNLLSEYVGERSWTVFSQKHSSIQETHQEGKKTWLYLGLGIITVFTLAIIFYPQTITYKFCFVDQDIKLPITAPLQVEIIKEGESSLYIQTTESGCFTYKTEDRLLSFKVASPYYKGITITRKHTGEEAMEEVSLAADEYALILHYFSSNNVDDWKTRRLELSKMIHDDAVIYQVFGNAEFGIDILSKEAFINKITLPTSSLRNMKILEISRDSEQIVKLKFETILDYE